MRYKAINTRYRGLLTSEAWSLWTLMLMLILPLQLIFASPTSENPKKPFLSSIPVLLLEPSTGFRSDKGLITLYPERTEVASSTKKNQIQYNYKIQENIQAPMLVIIPGIGGVADSNTCLFLSEIAFNLGYSVLTLPSTTHWSFALAASKTGRTGHLPADSEGLYRLLEAIKSNLELKNQIRPTQWGLLGTSYGVLDGSFLLSQDAIYKGFNFNFLIAINPPLSRSIAMTKTDQYYSYGDQWPSRKKKGLEIFFLNRVLNETQSVNKINTYDELEAAFPLEENELAWLMGNMFRKVVFNTASIGNKLENLESNSVSESFQGTMREYLREKIFKKYYKAETEDDYLNLESQSEMEFALSKINPILLNNKKIILFHGLNDYLSFPEGVSQLNRLPMEKYIYPYGGHLGLLSDDNMIKDLKKVLLNFNQ